MIYQIIQNNSQQVNKNSENQYLNLILPNLKNIFKRFENGIVYMRFQIKANKNRSKRKHIRKANLIQEIQAVNYQKNSI